MAGVAGVAIPLSCKMFLIGASLFFLRDDKAAGCFPGGESVAVSMRGLGEAPCGRACLFHGVWGFFRNQPAGFTVILHL
jgi:hypothetical protein